MYTRSTDTNGRRTDTTSVQPNGARPTKIRLLALVLAVVACGLVFAPAAASGGEAGGADAEDPTADHGAVLSALEEHPAAAQVTNRSDRSAAVTDGVEAGAAVARDQGVQVSDTMINETVERVRERTSETENASIDALEAAATGGAAGAFVQSQRANETQVSEAVGGAVAGSLTRAESVDESALRASAYGAAHGAVAHHARANGTVMAESAYGAAAGTVNSTDVANATVPQVQEAAQGSAYGALEGREAASESQLRAAARGAASGITGGTDADPKQVQAATKGAASSVVARSGSASDEQLTAAARGAVSGALERAANATALQMELAASGAAEGALRYADGASAQQIEAAARGAASGTLVQVQQVTVVQIQQAASGAAAGAVGAATQQQIADVGQIRAAAAGAGQGAVVQVQQVNVVQIQVIAEGATRGALSQHQQASVAQIQAAARGATEGTIELTQRQRVTVEQAQSIARQTASATTRTVVDLDIQVDVVIYQYALGTAGAPDGEVEDRQSLFVATDDEALFLANPNDESVTVTVSSEAGDLQTITLASGESTTTDLDPGTYTLTAETAAGESVDLAGRSELRLSIGETFASLSTTVDEETLSVENPNDEHATVTIRQGGTHVLTFDVPPWGDRTWDLEPGTYTLTAVDQQGDAVPIDGDDSTQVTIEAQPSLDLQVEGQNVTMENPSDVDVTATATNDTGAEQDLSVEAGETVTESFEPGNYTVEAVSAGGDAVLINGMSAVEVQIQGDDELPPIDLNVTVDEQNVTVDNPGNANVTVAATNESNAEGEANGDREFDVGANETATEAFEPGNYTLSATAEDDRNVTLEGNETTTTVSIPEDAEPGAVALDVAVDGQNVTLDNSNATEATVTAAPEDGTNESVEVPAEGNATTTLDPGNYTLTGMAPDNRTVTLDGQEALDVRINDTVPPGIDLNVTVDEQNVTADNPNETAVTVTAVPESGDNETIDVPGEGNVTDQFEAGNYTLTGTAEDERPVTFDGEANRTISVAAAGPERAITDCTEISEAGYYEVTEDVQADAPGPCLSIQASDVVLEGNDHLIEGVGPVDGSGASSTVGVLVDGEDGSDQSNVTVANATLAGWNAGLQAATGAEGDGEQSDVTVDGVTVRESARGIDVGAQDATVRNATLEANDGTGLRVSDDGSAEATNVTATENGANGVSVGPDGASLSLANSMITGNAEVGLGADEDATVDLTNVTIADNDGREVDAGQAAASASNLTVGQSARLDFQNVAIGLEPVESDALPSLPENATAAGSGLNVTDLDGPADLSLSLVAEPTDTLELWRYNGTEWTVSADANETTVENGSLDASVEQAGVYAPVQPPAEPEAPPRANVTVGNDVVWVGNPTEESITATISDGTSDVTGVTVDAGANESIEGLDPGDYFLTAETAAGDLVTVNDGEEVAFSLPPDLESLDLSVDGTVTVDNPNDVAAEVTVANDSGVAATASVPAAGDTTIDAGSLSPGNYTVNATTDDDRRVPVDGEWSVTVTIAPPETEAEAATTLETDTPVGDGPETETDTQTPTPTPTETATETTPPTAETSPATPTETPPPTPNGTESPSEQLESDATAVQQETPEETPVQ